MTTKSKPVRRLWRGRGWALSIALIRLPYYWEANPALAAQAQARLTIAQLLADC